MIGVAGEERVVGVPMFNSWGKYIMPLTNINSDYLSNASSGLCIILLYYINYIIYAGSLSCIFGYIILYYIILYYIILYYIILYYITWVL